jgi:phenylpropionate dioxygenase-like ring-hydroxylating dioxygenase large terminal subunit
MIAALSAKALRFWHPVLQSEALQDTPVELTLCGVELVLFRTQSGQAAALDSRCPHRKMRLALGHVEGDTIVCPYHGWRFEADGTGHSAATPAMKITTVCYEVREHHGAIWLRASNEDADSAPPALDFAGYFPLSLLHHRVDAPFQLLIDNMAELEHTATVHGVFGFELKNMHLVKTDVKVSDSELDIYYEGPQRKLPFHLALPTGIVAGDRFVQRAKVRFGPVHAMYDLEWHQPGTDRLRPVRLKFVIFFNPVSQARCEQFTFIYASVANGALAQVVKTFSALLINSFNKELKADIALVESLKLAPEHYAQYLPSRFDRPLREAARMIDTLYFNNNETAPKPAAIMMKRST